MLMHLLDSLDKLDNFIIYSLKQSHYSLPLSNKTSMWCVLSLGKFPPSCEKGKDTKDTYRTTLGQEASPSKPRGGSLDNGNSAKNGKLQNEARG